MRLIPANDPSILWQGRKYAIGSGYAVDWEGTAASITLADATYVGMQITDGSAGGSRWGFFFNNSANQSLSDVSPGLKVAIITTSSQAPQPVYTLASGIGIARQTATYKVGWAALAVLAQLELDHCYAGGTADRA